MSGGVDPARVVCGVGSGEILKLLAEGYAGPGDEVVFTEHGFSMYPIYANACGATPVIVPNVTVWSMSMRSLRPAPTAPA